VPAGARSNLVELRGITKVYGSGEAEVRALDGIDLAIARGEFIAITGPSGSGKSTVLNILGFLDSPTAGTHIFEDTPVAQVTRQQRTILRRSFLGFVFQGYNLLSRSAAVENVELPLIYRGVGRAQRRQMARTALARVGLAGREHHLPTELSGGQQQRVAIARAIVTNPALLLADEPTGNLDTATAREVMELLIELNTVDGMTIAMVTHEPDMAAYCGRQVRVVDGRIAPAIREAAPHAA